MACTVTIPAGESASKKVKDGAVVCLAPGVHPGAVFIDAPGTYEIRGEPGAVIDAGGRGAALHVAVSEAVVRVIGVELRGGHSELGAGVRIDGWSTVHLEDCVVAGNRGVQGAGGGLGASAGEVTLRRVRFAADAGLLLTGAAEVSIDHCEIAGEVRVREGAEVRIIGGRVERLALRGTTTRAPTVHVQGALIATPIENDPELPGTLTGVDAESDDP